jgi:uncharacterized lipoprotein YmbA
MRNFFCRARTIPGTCCMLLLLAGCHISRPTTYYLLQPAAASQGTSSAVVERAIGVGPARMAEYLDRPNMVLRRNAQELQLASFHLWAEPLKDNVTRVIAENLSRLLGTQRVLPFPWPSSIPVDYQVTLEVTRLDGMPGAEAVLCAWWRLFGQNGKTLLASRKSEFSAAMDQPGYEALVSAESALLAELSREIAAAIRLQEEQALHR